MRRPARLAVAFTVALAAAASAAEPEQVTARTAPPSEPQRTAVTSPMELSVPVAARLSDGWTGIKVGYGVASATTDTDRFVCDRAHVTRVQYQLKKTSKKGKGEFAFTIWLETGYFSQDVNLKVELLADGKVVQSRTWKELTIGSPDLADVPFAALPRQVSHSWRLELEQVLAIVENGATLRITVDIDD